MLAGNKWLLLVAQHAPNVQDKSALYAAGSAIVVSLIGAASALVLQSLRTREGAGSSSRRRSTTLLARYEKFFLVNKLDSRKIRNGYELIEDVRIERPNRR